MMDRHLALRVAPLCLLSLGLLACGSAAKAPSGAQSTTTAATAIDPPDKPETDRARKIRLAKDKRAQCQALCATIEKTQLQGTEIVNINDSAAMKRLAANREQAAQTIDAVSVAVPGLEPIRDEYAAQVRATASALHDMGAARSDKDRKAAYQRFNSNQDAGGTVLQKLTEFCNAPIQ